MPIFKTAKILAIATATKKRICSRRGRPWRYIQLRAWTILCSKPTTDVKMPAPAGRKPPSPLGRMNLLDRQYLRLVDASIRQVARGPDVGADQTFDLVGIDTLSEALIVGLQCDRHRDRGRHISERRHWRQQVAIEIRSGRRHVSQRLGCSHEHRVRDAPRLDCNYAQTHPGKYVGIVSLVDLEFDSAAQERRERTASAHDRPTIGPNLQILRGRFGPGGWVRQWEDDRPFIVFRHGAHHRFGEGAGLARDSDQYAGSCVPHHIQERDLVRVIQFPSTGNRFYLNKRLLIRGDVIHTLNEESVAIDHEKAPRRIALLQRAIHHSLLDKGGDAAACRACAQYDDTLLSKRHLGNIAR